MYSMYFLYHRFGRPILFILQRSVSTYLGVGFPSLGSGEHDLIMIALEAEPPKALKCSQVVQRGPEEL